MIHDASALQAAEEVFDLVDRNGVADADVDAPIAFQTTATVDADEFAVGVEERAARVAGLIAASV